MFWSRRCRYVHLIRLVIHNIIHRKEISANIHTCHQPKKKKKHLVVIMLSIIFFVLVLFFPSNSTVWGEPKISSFRKLNLSNKSKGPESITFDSGGGGPYSSTFDGKIVRYDSRTDTFQDFSYTKPNR